MKKYFYLKNKSFNDLEVSTHKELWEKVKLQGYTALVLGVDTIFQKGDKDNRFHFVFSTATEDRHGDIVEQNFDVKAFKKNPVLLDSHRYESIEHILGRVIKISQSEHLEGDVEFALDNPKGLLAYKMTEAGFINTTSIGFIPLEFGEDGSITKSELLEVSLVSVPANPEALMEKLNKKEYETTKNDNKDEEITGEDTSEESNGSKTRGEVCNEKSGRNRKTTIVRLAERVKKQDAFLKKMADELSKTTPVNLAERKRKLYKELRQIISRDIN